MIKQTNNDTYIIVSLLIVISTILSFLSYNPILFINILILVCKVLIILAIIIILIAIFKLNIPSYFSQTQQPSFNDQNTNNTSSSSYNSQTIEWTEIGTYYSTNSQTTEQTDNVIVDSNFLSARNQNTNINELLTNLIGQKDRASGEIFQPGEKVYFCTPCQLGYHEDSWLFLNKTCEQCKSSSYSKLYTLPIVFREVIQTINTKNISIDYDDLLRQGIEKSRIGNYKEAIESFSLVLQYDNRNIKAYYNRGFTYQKLSEYEQAINDYNQAIIIDPNYDDPYINRANIRYQLGDIQEAIKDYSQVICINPNNAYAYSYRGYIREKMGDIQGAIDDYSQALVIDPNHPLCKNNIKIARSKLKNKQNKTNNFNSNSITSSTTKIFDNYISALDLEILCSKVGRKVNVKGQIRSVRVDKDSHIIYLDFAENTFRGFYAYVLATNCQKFPNPTHYLNKNVVVCGVIRLNRRNQPKILLNNSSQLRNTE